MKYIGTYSNDADIATKKNVDSKQDKVLANGVLQGDGSGNISAAETTEVELVTLDKSSVGLDNVDNTSDANKPISTATQTALNNKQDKITASGILKGNGSGTVSAAVADTDYATCTNLLNGGVAGSARTINSRAPSDFYTMGENAFAEGSNTQAMGAASHAEGASTTAAVPQSHAEGRNTYAGGAASHAEGFNARVEAGADYSHAEGFGTSANHKSQHVQGEYNIQDDSTAAASSRGNYAHIVGNGTAATKSNAHTLDWSGNAWFAGEVYVGSTSGTNKDDGSKVLAKFEDISQQIQAHLNRATMVDAPDPNYTDYMARGIALTSDTTVQPKEDGTIVLYYEA